jgi:hypothetical protein
LAVRLGIAGGLVVGDLIGASAAQERGLLRASLEFASKCTRHNSRPARIKATPPGTA